MDNPETLATLGNKTLDDNKQNTTEKPIKMRQSRMDNPETLATLGNKTLDDNKQNTTEKPIKMTAIKNGQSRDTGNIGK